MRPRPGPGKGGPPGRGDGHRDGHRQRLPALAGDRQGGPERPSRRPPDRLADRHQERDPAGRGGVRATPARSGPRVSGSRTSPARWSSSPPGAVPRSRWPSGPRAAVRRVCRGDPVPEAVPRGGRARDCRPPRRRRSGRRVGRARCRGRRDCRRSPRAPETADEVVRFGRRRAGRSPVAERRRLARAAGPPVRCSGHLTGNGACRSCARMDVAAAAPLGLGASPAL